MIDSLVLSLFPGLELLDRAFRAEGFCVVAGPDRLLGGDIREFHAPAGRFDGVIGGSPCQSFSALANLVRAKGLEPRFGNLVPEFERVVEEAAPLWFLHENVPRAPIPRPAGYAVQPFTVCNSSIEGEDGLGQEQERVRTFTFGVRSASSAPNLLRWIPRAALRLPAASRTSVISGFVDNSPEAKRRVPSVFGDGRETRDRPKLRLPPLTGENGTKYETPRSRQPGLTGAHQCRHRPKGGHGERRSLPEMLRLQGLPEDLLDDQPFTAKAARKMVANGVPMPLGLAVARAVRKSLESIADATGDLIAWRDDEITALIRDAVSFDARY